MRNLLLAACLAAGLVFAGVGQSVARADHGWGQPNCYGGHHAGFHGYRGGYVAGFSPYGGFYRPPVVVVPRVYTGVYGVSRVGVNPYGFGYNNIPASRFLGGFGNLGYPNPYPRSVLRIGF